MTESATERLTRIEKHDSDALHFELNRIRKSDRKWLLVDLFFWPGAVILAAGVGFVLAYWMSR